MALKTDIRIKIRLSEVLAFQNREDAGTEVGLKAITEKCIALALSLITPVIVYDYFPVALDASAGRLLLEGGNPSPVSLTLGPHIHLLEQAEQVLVAVHSIGSALDAEISRLSRENNLLEAYLLDCAGLVALTEVGESLHQMVERKAAAWGWGVGPSLSPGSLEGWDLRDQKNLCSVLDIASAGLFLNDSCLLLPLKSASTLLGLGREMTAKKVGSICQCCNHRQACWRRKKREQDQVFMKF